jgi:decaprenylphospho-beta-D-ribofuranose 2-oxidase
MRHMPLSRLHGWGRTSASSAAVVELGPGSVPAAVRTAGDRGVLMRGLGRSYGDAAQNGGGTVLRLLGGQGDVHLDPVSATARVGAGVSIDELLRVLVPHGFFVAVTPGTRFVTVGGAIASDIHGKNHHADGSFGDHVRDLTMVLADGSSVVVGPDRDPELFWATVGGMGLTGAIVEATISLLPIETSRMSVDTSRLPDLDSVFAELTASDEHYRYSVAWIDLLAKGRHMGRGVWTRGDHATLEELPTDQRSNPFAYGPRQVLSVPPLVPSMGLVHHATAVPFNELWFRKAPSHREGQLQSIAAFFHPLDMAGGWNRVYGRAGMLQYQFVVPFGEEDAMRRIVERLVDSGAPICLTVLKRFGKGNEAPLSFPCPGWTLAIDVPAASRGLGDLLHSLDRVVLDAGGRHYFAKDATTSPANIRRGYPRLDAWKAVQHRVDPTGVWQSDMSRRLGLTESPTKAAS